jgi:hypothetical protein
MKAALAGIPRQLEIGFSVTSRGKFSVGIHSIRTSSKRSQVEQEKKLQNGLQVARSGDSEVLFQIAHLNCIVKFSTAGTSHS